MLAETTKREGRGVVASDERPANAVRDGLLVHAVCLGDLLLGPAVYPQFETPAELRAEAGNGNQKAELIAHGLTHTGGSVGERLNVYHALPPTGEMALGIGRALSVAWNGP
jgi:hypothetical protein